MAGLSGARCLGAPGTALRMAIGGTWTERRHVESAWQNIVEVASDLKS